MKPQCIKAEKIPLSIYVHLPWCKKKCPYCDFNSHEIKQSIPEKEYCEALLKDFFSILSKVGKRKYQVEEQENKNFKKALSDFDATSSCVLEIITLLKP